MADAFTTAVDDANQAQNSSIDMTNAYSLAMSQRFVATLSGQLSDRPSPKVQRRKTILITQMPRAALWTLVSLNLLFALFGIVLASIALVVLTVDVQQTQMKLSIAGLTAVVFEKQNSELRVKRETDLFQEHDKDPVLRRIGVVRTDTGGISFSASENGDMYRKV